MRPADIRKFQRIFDRLHDDMTHLREVAEASEDPFVMRMVEEMETIFRPIRRIKIHLGIY